MPSALHISETHNGVKVVFIPEDGRLIAEFNTRVHREKSDFEIYAGAHGLPVTLMSDEKSKMVVNILTNIFFVHSDTGVEKVSVKPYKLTVHHSRAVDVDVIAELVREGMLEHAVGGM